MNLGMNHKINTLLVGTLVFLLALVLGVGCQQTDVERAAVNENEPKEAPSSVGSADNGATAMEEGAEARAGNGEARAGDAVAGDGKARAGDVVAGNGGAEEKGDAGAEPGKVRLNIGGEPGTRFSGVCVVGGEEREVSGQVPGRFVYEPEGRKVECEIRKEGTGSESLRFSVDAGGKNSEQKIKVTGDSLDLSVSGNSVSYNISSVSSSSSSSSSVVQKSSVNSSSYSSSSSSSGSP